MPTATSLSLLSEPAWHSLRARRLPAIPAAMYPWIRDRGSLTRRLLQACHHGVLQVQVLDQRLVRPLPSERLRLGTPGPQLAWVREVLLTCSEQPWVFARTVIPWRSLTGAAAPLARAGSRPLGEMLFAVPGTERRALEVARLRPGDALHRAASVALRQAPGGLWGRRTLFGYRGAPLLVNEIFLPGLPAAAASERTEGGHPCIASRSGRWRRLARR